MEGLNKMQLANPYFLLLLLPVIGILYLLKKRKKTAPIKFSSFVDIDKCANSWRVKGFRFVTWLKWLSLILLIIAIARPREGISRQQVTTMGIAMEIVVDQSFSMSEAMIYDDKQMTRLDVVKNVLEKFIAGDGKKFTGRDDDLIGLIKFAAYADTVCPLVHGHDALLDFLQKIELADRNQGTAIGEGIALAAARLGECEKDIVKRNKKLKIDQQDENFKISSKVIVLLTDGVNNTGDISPVEAAKLAKKVGVKVYAIGIGDSGYRIVRTPAGNMKVPTGNGVDEELLSQIAAYTGGAYGKATDAKTLSKIIQKIDQLEKTQVKTVKYSQYNEKFPPIAKMAILLLAIYILAGATVFRKIP